jgi:hypothetical protein
MRLTGTSTSAGRHEDRARWIDLVLRLEADSPDEHDLLAELLQSGAKATLTRCGLRGGMGGVGIALRIDPGNAERLSRGAVEEIED